MIHLLFATALQVIVEGDYAQRADKVLRDVEGQGFAGVALVTQHGKTVLLKGYGLANRAAKTPMTPDTVVQIGSNTKDFTDVAILQLVEQGKLALTDPITKFFPNVPDDKRAITIDDLMHHRAGFPQHLGGDFVKVTRDDEIKNALASTLLFKPGEKESYSNVGYSLLAAIIEQTSGQSYDQYVHDHITAPLSLTQTGFLLPKFDRANVAHEYRGDEDLGTMLDRPHAPDGHWWNLRGNGGMLSTLPEMQRFYNALFESDKLLQPKTRALRFRRNDAVILAGSDLVFYFVYNREPEAGTEIIVASNETAVKAPLVRNRIAEAVGLGPVNAQKRVTESGPFQWPDTPASRIAQKYVAIFNAGDEEKMRAFIQNNTVKNPEDTRTIDQRVATFRMMRNSFGTLTPVAVANSSPYELQITVKSSGRGNVEYIFNTEEAEPYRLKSIRLLEQ